MDLGQYLLGACVYCKLILAKGSVTFSDQKFIHVVNFTHFHLFLQNHSTDFYQTWDKSSLAKGIQVC